MGAQVGSLIHVQLPYVEMGTHSDGYVEQELLTTFVTCEGDLSDPQFNTKFARLLKQLQKLLLKDPGQYLGVVKVEPWNSVRVTFTVPKEAALRLRQLAQQGDATLSQLGILSVQLEGDQAISLRIAGRVGGESREIVLRTSTTPAAPLADSADGGSSSSSSGSGGSSGDLCATDTTLAAAFDHHLISKSGPVSAAGVSAAGSTASFLKTMTQVTSAAMSAFKTPAVQSGSSSGLSFGCVMTAPGGSGVPPNKIITSAPMASAAAKNTALPQHSYHSAFVSTSSPGSSSAGLHHHQTAIVDNSHRFSLPPPPYPNAASVKQQQQSGMVNPASKAPMRTVPSAAISDDLLTGGLPSTTNASPANVALSSPLLVNLLQNDGVPNSNKIAAAAAAAASSSSSSSFSSQDKHRLKQSSTSSHIKSTVVLPSSSSPATTTTVARRKDTIAQPDLMVPDTGGGEVQQVIQRIQRGATSASSENNNLTMVTNVRIPVVECPTVTNPHMPCTSNNNQANTTDMAAAANAKLPTMNHLSTVTANVKQTYTSQSPVVNMFQRQVVATVPSPSSSAAGANVASVSKTAAAPTTLINNQLANRITYSHNDNQLVALAGHQSPHPQAKFGVRVINVQQQQSPQLQQQSNTQQQLFHQSQQQLLQKQLLQQQQQQQQQQISQYQQQHQQFIVSGNGGQQQQQQQQHAKSVILQQNVVASGAPKMGFVGGRMVTLAQSSSQHQQQQQQQQAQLQQQLQQQQQQQRLNELANDATLFNTGANDLVESVVDMLGAVAADSTTVSTKLEQIPSNNMVQFVKSFALSASQQQQQQHHQQQQQQQQQQLMAAKLGATPKLNNAAYGVLSSGLPTGYHNAVVTSTNAAFNQSLGDNQFDSIDGSDLFTTSGNGTTILTTQQQPQQQKVYQNTTLQQQHHIVSQQQQLQYATQQEQLQLAQVQSQQGQLQHQQQLPPQYSSRYVVTTTDPSTTKALIADQMKNIMSSSASSVTAIAVQQQPPPPPYSSSGNANTSVTLSSNSVAGGSSTSSASGTTGNSTSSSSAEKEPQFLINPLTGEMEPMPNEGSDNEESDNQTTDIFNSLPPSVAQNDDSSFSFSPPSSATTTPLASSVASNYEKSSSMLFSDDNDDDSPSRMSSPATRKTNTTTSEDDSNSGSGDIKPTTTTYGGDNFVTSTGPGRHRIMAGSGSAAASGSSGVEKSEIKIRLKLGKNEPLSGTGTYKVDVLNTTNKKVDKPTSIVKPMPRVLTTVPSSQSNQQQSAVNNAATSDEPRVPPIRLSLRGKNFGFVKKNKKWSDDSNKEPASTISADETILEKKSYFKNKLSPNEIVADDASIDVCSGGGKSPAPGTAIVSKLSTLNSDDTEELKVAKPTAKSRKSSAAVVAAAAAVIVDTASDEAQAAAAAGESSNEIGSSSYNVILPAVRTFPTEAEVTSILRSVPTDAPNKMSLSCVKIKKKEGTRKNKMFPRDRSSTSTTHTDDSTDTFTRVINETKCTLSSQSARGNKSKSNSSSLLKSVMKSTAAKEARMMNLANRNLEKRLTSGGQDGAPAMISGGKAAQAHQRRASAEMSYTVAITTTTFTNTKTSQRSSTAAAAAAAATSSSSEALSSFSGATQQFVPSSPHSANNLYPSSSTALNTSNNNTNNGNCGSTNSSNGSGANSSIKDISGKKFVVNNAASVSASTTTPCSNTLPATTTTTTKKIANNCKTTTAAASLQRDYQQSLKCSAATTTTSTSSAQSAVAEIRKELMINHDPTMTTTSKKSHFVKKVVDQIDAAKQHQQAIVVNCLQVESSNSATTAVMTMTSGSATLPTTHLELSEKVVKQRLLEDVSSFGEPQRKKPRLDTGADTMLKNGPVLDRLITSGSSPVPGGQKDVSNVAEVVSAGLGSESPSSGANSEHTNNQGEDSGIESMDALSEKSPNQGESPCRKEEKDGSHSDTSNSTTNIVANQREKKTTNAYCDKASNADNFGGSNSQPNDKTQIADNDISNVPIVTSSCNTTVAGKMITTSSLVLTNCLETSSPSTADQTNATDKDDKTASYERDDTMSPDLDDVQPFRVTPALFTYSNSNAEKMRGSPSPVLEDIADDISLSPKPVVILEQPKPSPRVKRRRKEVHDPMFVTTEKTKSSPGKSLLEQLLIDIPSDGGVEIRRTGMSTRNTRSQLKGLSQPSPDTLSMCSTSSSSSIKTPKCSPVPRSSDDTPSKPSPRPSNRLTSRRSRKGSESSNVSNGDETVTYGRAGKRKCSENASSEITKGCIGFEDQNGKKVAISANTSIEAFRTSISENNLGGTPTVVVSSTKANVTRSSTGAISKRINNLVGDVTQSTPTRHVGKKRKGIGDTPVNRKANYNKSNDNELALIQVAAGSDREELVSEQSVNVTSTTTPRANNRLSSNVNNSAAASPKQTTPAATTSRRSVRQNHVTRRRKSPAAAQTSATSANLTNSASSTSSTPVSVAANNNNNNSNKNNNMKPNASAATGSVAAAATDACKNVNNDKSASVNIDKIETKSISKLNCVTKKEIASQMTSSNSNSTTNSLIDTKITATAAAAAAATTSSTPSSAATAANHGTPAESCATASSTTGAAASSSTTNATAASTATITSATAASTITTSTVTTRGNSVKQTQHLINDSAIAAPPQDISHTHTVPVSEEVINTRRKTRSVANSNVSDELTNKRRRNSRDGK